jgi:hypothetical protein
MIETVSGVAQRLRVRRLIACLAVYVVFLLVAPFSHHDLLCHIRTHAHCTSCSSSQPGFASGSPSIPGEGRLACAGRARVDSRVADGVLAPLRLSGRAPPSLV